MMSWLSSKFRCLSVRRERENGCAEWHGSLTIYRRCFGWQLPASSFTRQTSSANFGKTMTSIPSSCPWLSSASDSTCPYSSTLQQSGRCRVSATTLRRFHHSFPLWQLSASVCQFSWFCQSGPSGASSAQFTSSLWRWAPSSRWPICRVARSAPYYSGSLSLPLARLAIWFHMPATSTVGEWI